MRIKKYHIVTIALSALIVLINGMSYGQDIDDYEYVFENTTFNESIQTVQLFPYNQLFAPANYYFDNNTPLLLTFDDFSEDIKDYFYTIRQCDHNWKLTDLGEYDYIDGFSEGSVRDYDFSFNTSQAYNHYQLTFPNQDMAITKSGNYAIIVYEEDLDKIAFIRRFRVIDPKVEVAAEVLIPRNPNLRDQYQEINFAVHHKGIDIFNPHQEIFAVVVQNERDDREITNVRPTYYDTDEIFYNRDMEVAFPSGTEFRELDIRTLRFRAEGVAEIRIRETDNDVYLLPDIARGNTTYRNEEDLNGKFVVEIQESLRPNIEGDYAYVHFFLAIPSKINNGSFYLRGGFNNWKIDDKYKLHYNHEQRGYECEAYLKQGFYNYEYVFIDDAKEIEDHSLTEGNFYETENDYSIYLFYKPFGQRYDQLIGVKHINSIF